MGEWCQHTYLSVLAPETLVAMDPEERKGVPWNFLSALETYRYDTENILG